MKITTNFKVRFDLRWERKKSERSLTEEKPWTSKILTFDSKMLNFWKEEKEKKYYMLSTHSKLQEFEPEIRMLWKKLK